MIEDWKGIVRSVAHGIKSIDDTGEGVTVGAVAPKGGSTPETMQRDRARSQLLWLVDQAWRAAKNGRADDARWWNDRAVCALWNMN
jgi:hypothetical protein